MDKAISAFLVAGVVISKAASDRAPVVLDSCMNTPMEKWNVGE